MIHGVNVLICPDECGHRISPSSCESRASAQIVEQGLTD